MDQREYDLIVIGSGPAGEKGAAQAAYFGKRVALIERQWRDPATILGGAAANTGTIPSKTLRETALFLSGFRLRELKGLDLTWDHKGSIRELMARERFVVQTERERIRKNLERHDVDLLTGSASLLDAHTVRVAPPGGEPYAIRGEVALIATGSSPVRPPGYRFEDDRIYDSDEILDLPEKPGSMLVVGGGVIGCEYACMFAVLGVRVVLIEKRDRLLGFLDAELSAELRAQMEKMGIDVRTGAAVAEVRDACRPIAVRLESGATLEVESILVSSGRSGNTAGLGLEAVGVELGKRGAVVVDDRYRTTVPNIYAAGDVIGFPALASTSMEQARVAMVHAFGLPYEKALAPVLPYGIYTIPECSMAGATEEELEAQGVAYVSGRASYEDNARGRIIGADHGFLKLLFRADDLRLLGVHILGEQATEIVHVGLSALLIGADAELFIRTCYNYPTLTEVYKYATYDALGRRQRGELGRAPAIAPRY